MENKKTCANCGHELDIGVDVIKADEGVIGMRDFVPLGKPLFFCCEKCLVDYFDMDALESLPRRIP